MPQQAQVLLSALQLIDPGVLAGEADAAPDPARIRPRCRSSVELLAVRSAAWFTRLPPGVDALLGGSGGGPRAPPGMGGGRGGDPPGPQGAAVGGPRPPRASGPGRAQGPGRGAG